MSGFLAALKNTLTGNRADGDATTRVTTKRGLMSIAFRVRAMDAQKAEEHLKRDVSIAHHAGRHASFTLHETFIYLKDKELTSKTPQAYASLITSHAIDQNSILETMIIRSRRNTFPVLDTAFKDALIESTQHKILELSKVNEQFAKEHYIAHQDTDFDASLVPELWSVLTRLIPMSRVFALGRPQQYFTMMLLNVIREHGGDDLYVDTMRSAYDNFLHIVTSVHLPQPDGTTRAITPDDTLYRDMLTISCIAVLKAANLHIETNPEKLDYQGTYEDALLDSLPKVLQNMNKELTTKHFHSVTYPWLCYFHHHIVDAPPAPVNQTETTD